MLSALHTGGHKPTSLLYNVKCLFYWGVFTEEVLVSFSRIVAHVCMHVSLDACRRPSLCTSSDFGRIPTTESRMLYLIYILHPQGLKTLLPA